MANKIESTEITQPKKVYVKSEEALDEMEKNGQLEPFTDYFTPDDEEVKFDSELSLDSENPVQNKVVTKELNKKSNIDSVNTNMLGVPSNSNWVNISITADQTLGTALGNGWILVRATSKNSNSWGTVYSYVGNTNLENRKVQSSCYNSLVDNFWSVYIPVKKGDTYKIHMSIANFMDYSAHFVPAEEV